jgi:hypothetical protein
MSKKTKIRTFKVGPANSKPIKIKPPDNRRLRSQVGERKGR